MVHVVSPFGAQKWSLGDKETQKLKRGLTLKVKISIAVGLILAILIIAVILVCCLLVPSTSVSSIKETEGTEGERKQWLPSYTSKSKLGIYKHAAVSVDAPPCAAIGTNLLKRNGSVIDAAIGVLLCMGVVEPQSMGLGGGFLMLYYNKEEDRARFIDAREIAPRKSSVNMFEGNATAKKVGALSIGVPGELAGYVSLHDEYGKLPWEDLFPPAIKLCEEGITVTSHLAEALSKYREEILAREHMRNVFSDNKTGDVYKEGDVYTRLDLAKTLKIISKEKRSAIYGQSDITNRFLADLEEAGSIISRKDLESYLPEIREPISITIRDNLTLYTSSLPASGALLSFMINVMDGYDDFVPNITESRNETDLALHRIIETFKFAYAKRMYLEDSNSKEMQELEEMLLNKDYADEIRQRIDDRRTHEPAYYGLNVTVQNDHGTAHLSIIAPNGDAVAVTSTVNQYFGSLVMSPSTGILLNDEMDDFSAPNITNYFELPPTGKNQIRPGKRPLSSITPTVIVDENKNVRLVIGANGGTQITTSVAQVILRNLWLNQTIKEAIDAPRFHDQLVPNRLDYETNFPKDILDDLKERGHKLKALGDHMLGIVVAIARDENGLITANSDYRKNGTVDGF